MVVKRRRSDDSVGSDDDETMTTFEEDDDSDGANIGNDRSDTTTAPRPYNLGHDEIQMKDEAKRLPLFLTARILDAKDLAKADTFGKSDPYCRIFWNNKEAGRTRHINNDLNPVWKNKSIENSD